MKKLLGLICPLLLACLLVGCGEHEHELIYREPVPATCGAEGSEGYWYCADCDKAFTAEDAVTEITDRATLKKPATGGHSYVDNVCTVCGLKLDAQPKIPFELNEEGTAYTFLGIADTAHITVPATYEGLPVTAVADNAFAQNLMLQGITLPDSVTQIGTRAFAGCRSLSSVTLGSGLQRIGASAFSECTSLERVSVPSVADWLEITFDGASATPFSYADELYVGDTAVTEITVPAGVTEIKAYAFYNMQKLTAVTLPDSVTRIGTRAFAACSRMTTCNMPAALTEIGAEAFYFCRSLSALTLPATVERIGVGTFLRCTSLTAATLTVTEGWSYGETPMEPAELADAATAARYLTDSHTEEVWTRAAS